MILIMDRQKKTRRRRGAKPKPDHHAAAGRLGGLALFASLSAAELHERQSRASAARWSRERARRERERLEAIVGAGR